MVPAWCRFAAFGLAFVGGWGWGARARSVRPANVPPPSEPATGACVDAAAMAANGRLAAELHDVQDRLATAERSSREREPKSAPSATATLPSLGIAANEWSRMAREGILRIRTPCSNWDEMDHFETRSPSGGSATGGYSSGRGLGLQRRAEAAGLSREELEALTDVYHRTQSRIWKKIESACGALVTQDESGSSTDDAAPATDEARIAACASAISPGDETTHRAMGRVAELHAAGASEARAEGPQERVLFALTESTQTLSEEMVHVLGREKAARALDYGIVCIDEMIYSSHPEAPEM
jgi:hypothetical protein